MGNQVKLTAYHRPISICFVGKKLFLIFNKMFTISPWSLLERKSRLYLVQYVPSKTASAVADTIISMLKPYQAHVHTITADNGSEFVEHERVAAELEAQVYFAHPYSAWERGQNENSNGLLRQYVPKGSDLSVVTAEALSAVEKRLNFRPRKCLGFKQPQVVFDELLKAA